MSAKEQPGAEQDASKMEEAEQIEAKRIEKLMSQVSSLEREAMKARKTADGYREKLRSIPFHESDDQIGKNIAPGLDMRMSNRYYQLLWARAATSALRKTRRLKKALPAFKGKRRVRIRTSKPSRYDIPKKSQEQPPLVNKHFQMLKKLFSGD